MSGKPARGSFPRPDAETREAFDSLVPDHPEVVVRPMFGNVAAFVKGNMFTGIFGPDLFVRLSEEAQAELIAEGGTEFEPMPGRPMKGYVALPRTWRDNRAHAGAWIERSLAWAEMLPPKATGRRRS